jgi:rSAM/selenodomain-associated transferase 2
VRLSVVVPAYNEAARVGGLVARLRALAVDEVLVVDGGSDDATAAIAAEAGAQVLGSARGRGAQQRAGAEAATGDVLWFLHADSAPPDDGPSLIRAAVAAGRSWGAFRLHTLDDGERKLGAWKMRIADVRSRLTRFPYGDQGIFCTAHALAQVGGFPPQALFEDLELSRRLSRLGPRVLLPAELAVSGRRFAAGPWTALGMMWTFPTLYRLGVPPETLAAWYRSVR